MTINDLFEPGCCIKRVFLCGAISNDPGYQVKFAKAAYMLTKAGYAVMNPAVLPSKGFEHSQYMMVTMAMLSVCDAIFFLSDWTESPGAMAEMEKATRDGMPGFSYEAWRDEHNRRLLVHDDGKTGKR